jgi:hypothetical protein
MAVRNKGVTQSVVPQANAMIDAEVSPYPRTSSTTLAVDTYPVDAGKIDALNNNTMVFYNAKHEIKQAKERSVQGNGNRARRVAVFQNYDGRDIAEIEDSVAFAGVTVSNANANGTNVEQNSTAVVVNGTNSAQNPEQSVIPIFSRLRWDVKDFPGRNNDKQTTIRGMRPQRLFCVKEESDNRAERIQDLLARDLALSSTPGSGRDYQKKKLRKVMDTMYFAYRALWRDNDGKGTQYMNNDFNRYAKNPNVKNVVDNTLLALCKALLSYIEYDERHRIGFSLGTPSNNKGQIDMHISRV